MYVSQFICRRKKLTYNKSLHPESFAGCVVQGSDKLIGFPMNMEASSDTSQCEVPHHDSRDMQFLDAPTGRLRSAVWDYFGICLLQPKANGNSKSVADSISENLHNSDTDKDSLGGYNDIPYPDSKSDENDISNSTQTQPVIKKDTWCKLCRVVIPYSKGNTTSMRRHLIVHHNIDLQSLNTPTNENNDCIDSKPSNSIEDSNAHSDDGLEFLDAPPNMKSAVWEYFGIYKNRLTNHSQCDDEAVTEPDNTTDADNARSKDSDSRLPNSSPPIGTWCRLCETKINYTRGNTTNMRQHLRAHHDINLPTATPSAPRQTEEKGVTVTEMQDVNPDFRFLDPPLNLKSAVWQYFGIYVRKPTPSSEADKKVPGYGERQPSFVSNSSNENGDAIDYKHCYDGFYDAANGNNVDDSSEILESASVSISDNLSRLSSQKGTWCKLCKVMMSYSGGNTSNMRQHLRRIHGILLPVINQSVREVGDGDLPSQGENCNQELRKEDPTINPTDNKSFLTSDFEIVPKDDKMADGLRRNYSVVWLHFGFYRRKNSDEVHQDYTVCKACRKMISYRGSNTTNMMRHLVRHHGWNVSNAEERTPGNPAPLIKVRSSN